MKLFLSTFITGVDQMTFLEENLCGTASAITKNIFLTKDCNKNILFITCTKKNDCFVNLHQIYCRAPLQIRYTTIFEVTFSYVSPAVICYIFPRYTFTLLKRSFVGLLPKISTMYK